MTSSFDVPLPPCVEKRRQRTRHYHDESRHAYTDAEWADLEPLWAESERREVIWGIWRHCTQLAEDGGCWQCLDDKMWPIWFSGRDAAGNVLPDRTVDIGQYPDEAGHAAVASGAWEPDQVMTARQIAEKTSRDFMRGKEKKRDG